MFEDTNSWLCFHKNTAVQSQEREQFDLKWNWRPFGKKDIFSLFLHAEIEILRVIKCIKLQSKWRTKLWHYMLKVHSFDRSSLSIDFHCSVHTTQSPSTPRVCMLVFQIKWLGIHSTTFSHKISPTELGYYLLPRIDPKTQQSQRIWCKPPILLSSGRRWSRTEAFGEVARQDRGEARWGQDRGECRHPIVFGIWESGLLNWACI